MPAPYILAKSFADAHRFAREDLGLERGRYYVVTSPSVVKGIRGADLYLVPGWKNRFDRFAMISALRWTRMNKIDVEEQQAEAPAEPDNLEPAGEQLTIVNATDFVLKDLQAEAPAEPEPERDPFFNSADSERLEAEVEAPAEPEEAPKKKNRRRSRCKDCGNLHYKDDPCPDESTLEGV